MTIKTQGLTFAYADVPLFNNLCVSFNNIKKPLVILGPSGSGKTTLLKLLAGLLKPQEGEVKLLEHDLDERVEDESVQDEAPKIAIMFQEPRLLPWLTVLENTSLPLVKIFGREEARRRALYFLSLVSLEEKALSYPGELSGGQAQRVSMARAFAWPAPVLLMDEPFQSLDIPLRLNLMDLTLSLLEKEKRLLIAVMHDPHDAIYMGERIIVLGQPGEGIVFDRFVNPDNGNGVYRSLRSSELESDIIRSLG